jgi:hypothetical protein
MPDQPEQNDSFLCVLIDPPDDLLERAARHNVDVDQVIIRFTKPRKIIARLPFQLLDGCEYIDDPQVVQEEFEDAVNAFSK